MTGIPAECTNPKCGYIFESHAIRVGPGVNINLLGNITRCPKCGAFAKFIDGNFSIKNNGEVHIKSAPIKTFEIIDRLKKIKKDLEEEKSVELSSILYEAGITGTPLEKPLSFLARKKGLSAVVAILIAIFVTMEKYHELDINEIFDQVLIATHAVTSNEAQELIDLRRASAGKEDSPHADVKKQDAEESKPPSSKPKLKRQKKSRAVPHKERRRETTAARSQRCPSQAPKSR
ncbi:hypothetical protein K6W36_12590 [Acetobacter senegalensis]|uniref:hypothetical protein n=1 Tax=Acetobacter senegalensis TaxID=446692 RepID=UPI001EDC0787|nr:hypothetical protein [Acetobacter senegalensis]MCG4261404.1 hypothetical protein [Acetobacter senegalensis]